MSTTFYAFIDATNRDRVISTDSVTDVGTWSSSPTYAKYSLATHGSARWLTLVDGVVGTVPGTDPTLWSIATPLNQNLPAGVGPQGPQGVQGPQGAQGGGSEFPPALITRELYVNKGGDDSTGDGTIDKPYLTVQAATAAVTDATPTSPVAIRIGPGLFGDSQTPIVFKPSVHLIGAGNSSITQIDFSSATWDNPLGFSGFDFWSAIGIEFYAQVPITQSTGWDNLNSILLFEDCRALNVGVSNTAGIPVYVRSCYQSTVRVTQGSCFVQDCLSPNITVGDDSNLGAYCLVTTSPNVFSGHLSVNGSNSELDYDATTAPDPSSIAVSNGGIIFALDTAKSTGYTPANSSGWPFQPSSVQEALDILAAKPSLAISVLDIDWSQASIFEKTLAANSTFTFSNATDGKTIVVALTNTVSNYVVTWPTVAWPGGVPPVQTPGAHTDIYTFVKIGSTIYGNYTQNF
jgi:hypothetical protein